MGELTKKHLVHSVMWNAIEKYSSQGIAFFISIVMARLLTPKEYGIVGIIGVFIGISQIFISSGMGNALISRSHCSKEDYCTANWINIGVSILCYFVIFFAAPLIAHFYSMPILTSTLRVMALSFIINSFAGVSRIIMAKEMRFKERSFFTVITTIVSGGIGIGMAYSGLGVWALVYQSVLVSLFSSLCIMKISGFHPHFIFSKQSFKELYSFGGKLLGSDLIWKLSNDIYTLIIGRAFNAQSVGYFTRAQSYSNLVPTNFSGILESVLFPAFSKIQDNEAKIKSLYGKSLTLSSFLVISGNFFLMGLAHPLIVVMISDKWLNCVPLLQILCLSSMILQVNSINGRLLLVKGFPGIFLKMSAVTQPLHLAIVATSFLFGLEGVAWGAVISAFLGTIYCCYLFKKATGINPMDYLRDSVKVFFIAGSIGLGALICFDYFLAPSVINLIIVATIMLGLYYFSIRWFLPNVLYELKHLKDI